MHRHLVHLCLAIVAASTLSAATAATHVARVMGSTTAPYGYVEFLPSAYVDEPSAKLPLILFLHGAGEQGAGTDATALMNAIAKNNSPHALIKAGGALGLRFNTEKAICLGPQSPTWWNTTTLHQFMTYAYATYPRIDRSRVYVTGLSMGGGGTWNYVSAHGEDVAACIPCCGASTPGSGAKFTGVATWSFHAWNDTTVTRQNSIDWSDEIAKWVGGLPAASDVMATYPYGDGSSTVATSIQTATYTAAGGWTWVTGVDATTTASPKMTMYTSGGHGGGWNPVYTNTQVWDWLFVQRLNTAPTISAIGDRSVASGSSTPAIAFTVGDTTTPAGSLTLSATTTNANLVPVGNVVFGGSGANRTVTVTPVAGVGGTVTLTVRVSDGVKSASESFVLTVTGGTTTTFAIEVDFGPATAAVGTDGPTAGHWNNITNVSSGSVASAVTTTGSASGIGIAVTNAFASTNNAGLVASDVFPGSAQSDSFYVQTGADNLGVVTFTNLDPLATYDIDIFASRTASDDRTTTYTIGAVSRTLNAANNTSQLARFTDVAPTGTSIALSVSAAASAAYGYLGALRLVQRPTSSGNAAPTVAHPITGKAAVVGSAFTYTFASNTFADANGDTLTYSASGMPAGIAFTAGTRTFAGTPGATGISTVTLTAIDGHGGSVSTNFVITVTAVVDTTPPAAPSAPITSSTTSAVPTLSGTTEANATVRIYDGAILLATVVADAGGGWSWTVSPALAAGAHSLTVTATDAADNTSTPSLPTVVEVPTSRRDDGGSDGGSSSSGGQAGGCGAGALGLIALASCLALRSVRTRNRL